MEHDHARSLSDSPQPKSRVCPQRPKNKDSLTTTSNDVLAQEQILEWAEGLQEQQNERRNSYSKVMQLTRDLNK